MQKYIWVAIFTTALGISSEITEMQKACERKMPTACYELGQLYEEGLGVDKNISVSKSYFQKACEYGYDKGCKHLDINSSKPQA
jgi:TPR repeat protein